MVTLRGKIADVTGRAPDSISLIAVKAPSARIGSGTDVIVSSPAEVTFDKTTGDITISGLHVGLSWLYIEGDGWSDSIPLAVAEGMITLVEAIANAAGTPGLVDYIEFLVDLQARIDDIAQGAVDAVESEILSSADTVKRMVGIENAVPAEGIAWAHTTEDGYRLPLGYAPDGRLDPHAKRVFREDVSRVYDSVSNSDLVHATISDEGHLILGIHQDGRVQIPGLGAVREGYSVYHRDGELLPAVTDTTQIIGWGSSTIARFAPYMQDVAHSVGATYHDGGKGAEQGESTAARIGATPVRVTLPDNLIPESGPVTATEATVPGNNFIKPYEVTIAGVHGLMESVANDWTFTRTTPGDPVPVEPGTPVEPVLGHAMRDAVNLLNIGKNTFRDDRPWATEQIITLTDDAFDWLSPLQKKSLVIGHYVNRDEADDSIERQQIMDVMAHQKARYGRLYVDLYALVTTNLAWEYTGLTPTTEDLALQARGNLPPSLTNDGGHLNDVGYRAFAAFLLDHMISLGWY